LTASLVSSPAFLALIAIAGSIVGAFVNGALATRAKVNEEMRQLRLSSYPLLWQMTSQFSRWPRMPSTYADLDDLHRWFRSWYYEAGGLHLSENSRTRYGEAQELMAAHLGALESKEISSQSPMPVPDDVYGRLLDSCSALRIALTEDLESRRQRSVLYRIRLAARHWKQKRNAARLLTKAKQESPHSRVATGRPVRR
jgi:hypothetical protein